MIKVYAVKTKAKGWILKWQNPVDGLWKQRKANAKTRREADQAAGALQSELNSGHILDSTTMSWAEFRKDFEQNYLDELSRGYQNNVGSTLNMIEEVMRPDRLNRITTEWLKLFRRRLLQKKTRPADATVHKYFQHLHTLLDWAVNEQDYLPKMPKFPKQKKKKGKAKRLMKGRPITGEEYDRMVAAVPDVFPRFESAAGQAKVAASVASVRHLMEGLWLSGLRLGEALSLTWDQWADGIRIEVDGDDVFLQIDAEDQKNGEVELYPVVDDFAEFLLHGDQNGFVFQPIGARGKDTRRVDTVSKWIVAVGEAAGVVVDKKNDEPVYASAHDLRRAFGQRWANRGIPVKTLCELMRHSSITTTEQYYLTVNAKETLRTLRRVAQSGLQAVQP